jgi:hypothetical protein
MGEHRDITPAVQQRLYLPDPVQAVIQITLSLGVILVGQ